MQARSFCLILCIINVDDLFLEKYMRFGCICYRFVNKVRLTLSDTTAENSLSDKF